MTRAWAWSLDLHPLVQAIAVTLVLVAVVLLVLEARGKAARVWASGVVASIALLAIVLRPGWITTQGTAVGPKAWMLVDGSASMDVPQERWKAAKRRYEELLAARPDARVLLRLWGEGVGRNTGELPDVSPGFPTSDLDAAMAGILEDEGEQGSAVVVVSDGAFNVSPSTIDALRRKGTVVHAAQVGQTPTDLSLLRLTGLQAAVAHRAQVVELVAARSGQMSVERARVELREVTASGAVRPLASGELVFSGDEAIIQLPVTFEQAGPRVVEILLEVPAGDEVPANNVRRVSFHVARDRIRLLHIAGRPTSDVRALRAWLKADAAIDLVTFFILRTLTDDVRAPNEELALIPFPIDELFTEHLGTFDAIILQDFSSTEYQLSKYATAVRSYVRAGGGLVLVGGPDSFSRGGYGKGAMADVLPVALVGAEPFETTRRAAPVVTELGRRAPPLSRLSTEALPAMEGANLVGDLLPGAHALWVHPDLKTPSGAPMPLLAMREVEAGRSVSIAVDGTWRLAMSPEAERSGGRDHAHFWDGIVGWLMREPRYEGLQLRADPGCRTPGEATVEALSFGEPLRGELTVRYAGGAEVLRKEMETGQKVGLPLDKAGSLVAAFRTPHASVTLVFACEDAGQEWADVKVRDEAMRRLAEQTGGEYFPQDKPLSPALPPSTMVRSREERTPAVPSWVLAMIAAGACGLHWIVRRQSELS